MNKLRPLEPTLFTTPKGEELILLTLTRAEWEALHAVLERSDVEAIKAEESETLLELSERLERLEANESPEQKQAWQDAVARAKPARYIPGQGSVVNQ